MFILPNFHKIQSILSKTDIFYQTNEFESTTGAKYNFAKLLLRDPLIRKTIFCVSTDIDFDLYGGILKRGVSFTKKISTDGARTFKCIGSD